MALGDERLNKRAKMLMERLSAKPTACRGWGETVAAYRFLGNDEVDWQAILAPHWQRTRERMHAHPVALCLQDTTELDFNGQGIAGLGRLNYEARRGMYLHPTYAVTPEREPLGVLDAWMWAREEVDAPREHASIKESARWTEGSERVAELAMGMATTRLVYVADREADLMDMMLRAQTLGTPADWLVRARRVSLLAGKGGTVWATCVVAREIGAPAGTKPVQWRLLTNREASTIADVVELIDWYRARWEIETFFHVVKNGCRIEALQLPAVERLERAIALFMFVAWRIAHLMRTGRTCPDLDASLFFDPDEIRGTYLLTKKTPPATPPTINQVLRLIATLAGFLARKDDGKSGVKTMWLGLQRVRNAAATLQALREEAA